MEISILDSYDEISQKAAAIITSQLEAKSNTLLCAATGNSPTGTYEILAKEYTRRPGLFDGLRVLKLDEWGGVPMDDPGTCESYLRKNLLTPLQIPDRRYISFNSNPEDPQYECLKTQANIDDAGPIDCCVLGLGLNGHLALNEPAPELQTNFHRAGLTDSTLQHSMVTAMGQRPLYGLTLGMADILQSRLILLLVSGPAKKKITLELLSKKVTTHLPASFLWLHPNTICLLDKDTV